MTHRNRDPQDFLPLNPLEFRILLALRDGCLHGYAIVKDVEEHAGERERIFPANLYRRIRNLLAAGLLAETKPPSGSAPDDDRPRKFFRLTPLGLEVARAEARRLAGLLSEAHDKDLYADESTP
ncbi:MAG: helix-turn-helix transcriptional regulator [Acidobacteriota bacterium]|jgi:DNA-binding PadR family transcriptional regulator